MAILRNPNKEKFTVVDNYALRDENLSLKARGLLVTMMSLPDNWHFSEVGLCAIIQKDGQSAIRSSLKELEQLGYLTRTRIRDNGGRVSNVVWTICDKPQLENPSVASPSVVNPNLENQPQLNTNRSSTNKSNTDVLNTESICRKRPTRAFVPPTVEEVQAYCYEISASIDPSAFVDYYAAQGWVYGKAGKQMKDWRAAVRNWNRREKQNGGYNGNRTGVDQRGNGDDCQQNQPTKRLKNAFDYLDEIRARANDSRPVEQTTGDIDWDELFGVP